LVDAAAAHYIAESHSLAFSSLPSPGILKPKNSTDSSAGGVPKVQLILCDSIRILHDVILNVFATDAATVGSGQLTEVA
jgi:hypothetical protein